MRKYFHVFQDASSLFSTHTTFLIDSDNAASNIYHVENSVKEKKPQSEGETNCERMTNKQKTKKKRRRRDNTNEHQPVKR